MRLSFIRKIPPQRGAFCFNKRLLIAMKLTIVLLTAVCLQAAAKTNAQNISLSEKSISLEKALQKIKAQSGYEFFYDRKILSLAKEPISVKLANGTLNQALDLCFKDQPKLTYSIVGKVIVVRKKVNPSVIEALTTTADLDFAGVVVHITDSAGLPLRGATVRVEGTSLVGQSDDKGNVSFTNVPDNAKLVITYVGYQTINIRTGGKSDIAVTLQPAVSVQTEVVVVGYGTQKRLTVTGSVAQVKGEDLVKSPAANLSNTLAGRIPGLSAFNTSGQPGADGANILIRGVNSFGNTGALVVIDGVPDRAGGLERLASGDIESVSVLKDASAAIYGQRSANGVILITTKRGKAGKTSVTYSFSQGISQLTEVPKMMNSTQYGTVVNELAVYPLNVNPSTWSTIFHGLQTNGTYSYTDLSGNPATIVSPAGFAPTDMQKYKDGSDPWGHPNTDWYGAVLAKWAPQQRHNLQMTGGTDNIKYLVSMGYLNQDGNYKNSATRYKQYDLRANVDFKLNKYINFVVGALGREENRLNPTQSPGTIFRFITRGTPNLQAYWPNGLPGPDLESGNQPVLLSTNATGYDKDVRDYYQSNGKIEIRIPWVEGLKLTGTASVDKYQRNEKIWQQPWYEYTWDGTTYQADGKTPQLTKVQKSSTPNAQPSLSQNYENQTGVTLTGMLNYDHKFGNHTIAFMAGYRMKI